MQGDGGRGRTDSSLGGAAGRVSMGLMQATPGEMKSFRPSALRMALMMCGCVWAGMVGGERDGEGEGEEEEEEEDERFAESLMEMFCGGKVPAMRCGGAVICHQGQGCLRVIVCDGTSQLQAVHPDKNTEKLPPHCGGIYKIKKVE